MIRSEVCANVKTKFTSYPAPVKRAEFHEFPVRRVRVNVSARM